MNKEIKFKLDDLIIDTNATDESGLISNEELKRIYNKLEEIDKNLRLRYWKNESLKELKELQSIKNKIIQYKQDKNINKIKKEIISFKSHIETYEKIYKDKSDLSEIEIEEPNFKELRNKLNEIVSHIYIPFSGKPIVCYKTDEYLKHSVFNHLFTIFDYLIKYDKKQLLFLNEFYDKNKNIRTNEDKLDWYNNGKHTIIYQTDNFNEKLKILLNNNYEIIKNITYMNNNCYNNIKVYNIYQHIDKLNFLHNKFNIIMKIGGLLRDVYRYIFDSYYN